MSVLKPKDYELLLGCLGEIYSLEDSGEFPTRLLAAVSRLVRARLITLTEVDPVLEKSTGYYFPAPPPRDFEEPFQRNIKDHPVVRDIERTRDGRAKAVSDFLSAKAFRATGLYQEVFKPLGVVDQLSISLVGAAGLMIGISFNRDRRGFSQRDREILNLVRPHIVRAYMICRSRQTSVSQSTESHARIIDQLPVGLVCLKTDGRIAWSTAAAQRMLRQYYSDAASSLHGLPDPIRYWLKQLSTKEAKFDDPASQLLSRRPGFELRLRYCPLDDGRAILLLQEPPVAGQLPPLDIFGFTLRERQVAQRIVGGDSIREAANALAMSPRTVGKHLERIFRKLGVNNLAAACVKMLKSDVNPA
jgi:DNA-binding CsgD family transcriptional regulator